ncbi:MAG: M20 family metallopeptidase [Bacteroidia bacterium]|nr:M20 family metallopeptidase [Bacteroidia bacterium]
MELKTRIQNLAGEIFEDVISLRRHIHANPELSFEEKNTAAFVQKQLQDMGIEYIPNIAGHGVVGLIHGKNSSDRVIALRADMDALPIVEANEVPYKSRNEGVMHACGHDVHTSSLLGTARILSQLTDQFSGTIKLIFQPAEEKEPGGASLMIRAGVLETPKVNSIIGQHVHPFLPVGKIGIRSGMYMASADEIYMRVIGKGGHAAHPAHFIDPVTMTAQILVTLQQVVSRSDPRIPTILSFGKVIAQGATNIIPNEVYVEGTLRTMNEAWRAKAKEKIADIVHSVAKGLGGRVELDIRHGYPFLVNDEVLTARTKDYITEYMGPENVEDLDIWMAAEDFAWYTHEVPGCFYRLGTRNETKGIVHGVHTPLFNIDEDAMKTSTGLMAWLAIRELTK